jgi:hypothetical protein
MWYVAHTGDVRNVYKILVGKHDGKRPRGRSTRRWEDIIRLDLRKMGGKVWTGFIWLRIGTCSGLL